MNGGAFVPQRGVHRFALPYGATLLLDDNFLSAEESEALYSELASDVPWRHEPIVLFGKTIMQPRLTAWFGDPAARYRYSGLSLDPMPWLPSLEAMKSRVERAAGCPFNSVLLNYYRDGSDSMGYHADNEPELGENPTIASLSLGVARRFLVKERSRDAGHRSAPTTSLLLGSGSLLVMAGTTQRHYVHAVPKMKTVRYGRINLTFRTVKFGDVRARPKPASEAGEAGEAR